MNSPSSAFAWELWTRHNRRLITMALLLVGFAALYPLMCSISGFDLTAPDALEALGRAIQPGRAETGAFQRVAHGLWLLALTCGPAGVMLISLLFIMWISTFTTFDPGSKDAMAFPMRLFTLPVTTSFLFWWMTLAGQLGVIVFHTSWVWLVRMPNMELFGSYRNCFLWMTMLALTQGITWSLAAWPVLRTCLLGGLGFGVVMSPAWPTAESYAPWLFGLLVGGMVLGRVGLEKIRHGQWQSWDWDQIIARIRPSGELRGPTAFSSPEQAQLWFEWRRFARRLCIYMVASSIIPMLGLLALRVLWFRKPVQGESAFQIGVILMAMPIVVHLCFSLAQSKMDIQFAMLRPLTNGQIIMATLKASGIFTIASWLLAGVSVAAIPLLGRWSTPERSFTTAAEYWPITGLALALLCWRLIAVNLGFAVSDHPRLKPFPAIFLIGAYALTFSLAVLSHYEKYWNSFIQWLPAILACLVGLKMVLGLTAFRLSIKRRLLSASAAGRYFAVWCLMAAVVMAPVIMSFHGREGLISALLGIIVLTPFARIGFAPLGLEFSRHQ